MSAPKLHKLLFEAVVKNCDDIFNQSLYADKVIEYCLKSHRQWGSRDRAFVASHTYDLVRWKRLLQYVTFTTDRTDKAALWLMLGALRIWRNQQMADWSEWKNLNAHSVLKRFAESEHLLAVMHSIPDWLQQLGEAELHTKWNAEMKALNELAPLCIRVNTLKTTKVKLKSLLQESDIDCMEATDAPDALILKKRTNLFNSPLFAQGYFEVQDVASQLVAPFMQVMPGMRVIDACAGAGGKTLHIASLMQNKGKIIALDSEAWKLDELSKRARRAGVDCIETRPLTDAKILKRLANTADRLLLDVPCSGLGVLRRNPDAKWKMTPEFIARIRETQLTILQEYTVMLKPGGKLVYATCSILPSEDEDQVRNFLSRNTEYTLEEEHRTWPSDDKDGFYMARLLKKQKV
ncbi:MAG: RsmB/NOP family class I SAM-dependent RNA methyltransferase [Bacteroidota bacterium]|jgi:16S rRNA (cytosine967-C5)-methyltransferase